MTIRFEGKVVAITGASSGIGGAAARQFAAQGARVALMARTESALEAVAAEIQHAGGKARCYPLDVRDTAACEATLARIDADLGGIDILVNNAGANARGPLEAHAAEAFAGVVDVNLRAPIVMTRLTLPYLRRRGGGAIVNVASIAGQIPVHHEATYSATKFGLRAFTFAMRDELEGSGITISAVSPGPVDTGFIMEDIDAVPDLVFANPMSSADQVAEQILLCAADGVAERTIPVLTGYMARIGNALPALRRVLIPVLEKRGRAAKATFRARRQGG